MTDQSYGNGGSHEGYDPYGGYPPQAWQEPDQGEAHAQHAQAPAYAQWQAQQAAWPGQQGHEDPHAAQQYTQQWQGQTWETQTQPPVPGPMPPAASAAETAYLPPVTASAAETAYLPPVGPGAAPAGAGAAASAPPAAAGGAVGTGYGPATLAGNARVTDAQRARAEGRSPIIEPGMQPAVLTALLGLLLAGTATLGTYALLVPLIALQGLTAAGWFRLNGMWPARQGIALGFAGALVADAALLVSGRAPAAILGTLGVWVLLSLVLQLRSHADPDERMYGLMATVAAAALAIVAGGYLAAGTDAVTVGAAAVAAAVVARALPLPTPLSVAVALLAGAGAGAAAGAATGLGTPGALLGAGAAVCALIGHRVASYDYPSRFVHFTAGVALPLAAAAPAVYVLGRVVA
ncbi:hypothetical protein ACIF8T_12240 [Streptomyces sp. NPDC085946]|uniref:hypothetical protein n=1 Tax=Streptomyces sp. NPDC085946 TaxID=3365744 RepID=UPI0037D280B3